MQAERPNLTFEAIGNSIYLKEFHLKELFYLEHQSPSTSHGKQY